MFEEYDWNEIYSICERKIRMISPDLLDPIHVQEIKFKYNGKYDIAGYDWVHFSEFDKRIQLVTEKTDQFLYFGPSLNKGTLQTAMNLVEAMNHKEKLAAIWLYSTIKEIEDCMPDHWRGEGYRILKGAEMASFSFLKENNIVWHHSMRTLIPEVYFSYEILEKINLDELDTLIELAVINSALIKKNYQIVYYESYVI